MARQWWLGSMRACLSALRRAALPGLRLALAVMCSSNAWPVHAAQDDLESVYLDGFVDRRASETKVGGRPLVGTVALGEPAMGVISPALVFPRGALQAPVSHCVETVSIDGAYWSQGQVTADVLRRGTTRLRIRYGESSRPSEESEINGILGGFGPANVAVLVTVGACQDEAPEIGRAHV